MWHIDKNLKFPEEMLVQNTNMDGMARSLPAGAGNAGMIGLPSTTSLASSY
jgi:hypothetical protein